MRNQVPIPIVAAARPAAGPGWDAVVHALATVLPDAVPAPSLTLNGTDGYWYRPLARAQYRFVPVRLSPDDLKRIHGVDERIAVANYAELVRFFAETVRRADGPAKGGAAGRVSDRPRQPFDLSTQGADVPALVK